MAERVFGLFPSPLIGADGTQATTEPLVLVSAEKDPEHLARSTAVVLARLVPRHAASQGIDRYTGCKDDSQEADRRWVTSVCDAACLDQPKVWSIVGRGASRLAQADPSAWVRRHYPVGCWTVRWLRSRVYVHMVSGDGGAKPKVSLLRDEGGVVFLLLTCARGQPPWLP
jgi:hypothetical protein